MAIKTRLRPLDDHIVVEPLEEEEQTFAGGKLVLPDTAKEKPQQGHVLAVGPGRRGKDGERIPLDVKVGDIIVFAKYAGTALKAGGEEVLFMRESDVLAVLS